MKGTLSVLSAERSRASKELPLEPREVTEIVHESIDSLPPIYRQRVAFKQDAHLHLQVMAQALRPLLVSILELLLQDAPAVEVSLARGDLGVPTLWFAPYPPPADQDLVEDTRKEGRRLDIEQRAERLGCVAWAENASHLGAWCVLLPEGSASTQLAAVS